MQKIVKFDIPESICLGDDGNPRFIIDRKDTFDRHFHSVACCDKGRLRRHGIDHAFAKYYREVSKHVNEQEEGSFLVTHINAVTPLGVVHQHMRYNNDAAGSFEFHRVLWTAKSFQKVCDAGDADFSKRGSWSLYEYQMGALEPFDMKVDFVEHFVPENFGGDVAQWLHDDCIRFLDKRYGHLKTVTHSDDLEEPDIGNIPTADGEGTSKVADTEQDSGVERNTMASVLESGKDSETQGFEEGLSLGTSSSFEADLNFKAAPPRSKNSENFASRSKGNTHEQASKGKSHGKIRVAKTAPEFRSRTFDDMMSRAGFTIENADKLANRVDRDWSFYEKNSKSAGGSSLVDSYCRAHDSIKREAEKDHRMHQRKNGRSSSFQESLYRRGLKECLMQNKSWVGTANSLLDFSWIIAGAHAGCVETKHILVEKLLECAENGGVMSAELIDFAKAQSEKVAAEVELATGLAEMAEKISRKRPIGKISGELEDVVEDQMEAMQSLIKQKRNAAE